MRSSRHPTATATGTILAVALLLTSCTAGGTGQEPVPASTPTGPSPEDVIATRTLTIAGVDVETLIHPVVIVGEYAVLTLDLVAPDPIADGHLSLGRMFENGDLNAEGNTSLRLLDLEADLVYLPAVDSEPRAVGGMNTGWDTLDPGETGRVQVAYAAPTADHVALLLASADLVEDIPVIVAAAPEPDAPAHVADEPRTSGSATTTSPSPSESAHPPIDLASIVRADVLALESSATQLDIDLRTTQVTDRLTIALGSDVLFATDSADLAPEAQTAIELAVEELHTRGAGTVTVVGHTDSVASDTSNQDLSVRRAGAVAAALTPLLDPAQYPLEVSGKGESEPVADNASDEGRRLNRRVELTLSTERLAEPNASQSTPLPPAPALTATGEVGVVLGSGSTQYSVRAPRARIVDGHLVVPVEVSLVTAGDGEMSGPSYFNGWRGTWGSAVVSSVSGILLLQGSTGVRPLDYPLPYLEKVAYLCACDVNTKTQIAHGQTATFTIVYPAVGAPTTVTIQNGDGYALSPFRLTDIPVEQP